ncbi:MBL fold metallo-hydrolase [Halomarina ordinaria]|uniref:MBL fold metallo-hydrolase n=1 Tax=Halomarina ordinaria TaxID=3033939 RepID=A0ABD5UC95_9EURY|nr:MBL fold metallo-hydrolase [Halomarina sp. PSRA2]
MARDPSSASTEAGDGIDAATLRERLVDGESVHLLDVRNRDEREEWRIDAPASTAIPYMRFVAAQATDGVADLAAALPDDETVVAVCPRGEASAEVAALLREVGVDSVNLDGGMEGWARLYESTVVSEDPTVVQYLRPSSGCVAYLVVDDGEAAVVDPLRAFADRYVADAADHGADLVYALDTHVHADHVSGVRDLADRGVEPVLPAGETDRGLADPERFTLLDPGEAFDVGGVPVDTVAAPGHTTETTAYRVGDVLLTGDGLFTERVPRPDLEAGAEGAEAMAGELYATLTDRFASLSDDLVVAPGHVEPDATVRGPFVARLGDLRERLPAFDRDREAFVAYVLDRMGPRPANHERVIAVNLGRDSVDDEEAFELELGPNNCAAG